MSLSVFIFWGTHWEKFGPIRWFQPNHYGYGCDCWLLWERLCLSLPLRCGSDRANRDRVPAVLGDHGSVPTRAVHTSTVPGTGTRGGVPPPKKALKPRLLQVEAATGAAAMRAVRLWSQLNKTETVLSTQPKTSKCCPRSCLLLGTLPRTDSQLSVHMQQNTNDQLFLALE